MNNELKICSIFVVFFSMITSCSPNESRIDNYEKFGARIVRLLSKSDFENFVDLFNYKPAYAKVLTSFHVSEEQLAEENSLKIKIELNSHFVKYAKSFLADQSGARFAISKINIDGGQHNIAISLQHGDNFNFIEFKIIESGGELRITDFYNYMTGEHFTDAFIAADLPRITGMNRGKKGYIAALGMLKHSASLADRGEFREAWFSFNQIEYTYQWEKPFQKTKLQITKHISDSLYRQTFFDFINRYKNEDKLRLFKKFQYYYEFRDMENADIALDSLITLTGESFVTTHLRKKIKNGFR